MLGVERLAPRGIGRRGGRLGELVGGGEGGTNVCDGGLHVGLGRLAVDERTDPGDLRGDVQGGGWRAPAIFAASVSRAICSSYSVWLVTLPSATAPA